MTFNKQYLFRKELSIFLKVHVLFHKQKWSWRLQYFHGEHYYAILYLTLEVIAILQNIYKKTCFDL